MKDNTPVRWSWTRPVEGHHEFFSVVRDELLPWRDSGKDAARPWSLTITDTEFVVTSFGHGPNGWAPCPAHVAQPVLDAPSPAEVLLQSIASDLFVLIAAQPVEQWGRSFDALALWPHRRTWRARGSRSRVAPVRPALASSVVTADLQRGLETAWSVVSITVDAVGRGVLRADDVWGRLVDRIRRPLLLAVPAAATPGAEVNALG